MYNPVSHNYSDLYLATIKINRRSVISLDASLQGKASHFVWVNDNVLSSDVAYILKQTVKHMLALSMEHHQTICSTGLTTTLSAFAEILASGG